MIYLKRPFYFNLLDERKTNHENRIINFSSPNAKQEISTSVPDTSDLFARVDPASGGPTTLDPDDYASG